MAHGLSLGVTVIAGAAAWGKIRERIDESGRRIRQLEYRCDEFDELAVRFAKLSTDIGWIKELLSQRRDNAAGDERRRRHDRRDKDDP